MYFVSSNCDVEGMLLELVGSYFGGLGIVAGIRRALGNGGRLHRPMLLQGSPHHAQHAGRGAVVVKAEKSPAGVGRIQTLCGAAADLARTLVGDLLVKLTLVVLLPALVRLIDGHWDEAGLQQLDDGGICKGRLTVEDTIVSRAPQRMPVHGPDENRLPLPRRSGLRVQHRGFPRDGPPRCLRVRLQLAMKF